MYSTGKASPSGRRSANARGLSRVRCVTPQLIVKTVTPSSHDKMYQSSVTVYNHTGALIKSWPLFTDQHGLHNVLLILMVVVGCHARGNTRCHFPPERLQRGCHYELLRHLLSLPVCRRSHLLPIPSELQHISVAACVNMGLADFRSDCKACDELGCAMCGK